MHFWMENIEKHRKICFPDVLKCKNFMLNILCKIDLLLNAFIDIKNIRKIYMLHKNEEN